MKNTILFILVLLVIRGFFSLVETAIGACRKTFFLAQSELAEAAQAEDPQAETKARAGKYRRALQLLENPKPLLASIRLGIAFFGIWAGLAAGFGLVLPLASRFSGFTPLIVVLASAVLTLVAEFIPKRVALALPERIIVASLPLLRACAFLAKPLVSLNERVAGLIFKLLRLDPVAPANMTEDELRLALAEGEKSGIVESKERTMVEGVFYLGDRPVGAFMTHRSEIQWLDLNAESAEIRDTAIQYRAQRYFPVADGVLDEVAGVVSVQDILLALLDQGEPSLKLIMKSPHFVPQTMSALKAFEAFKKADADILLVMDEYGGFAGVLLVRSLIEEIVGQLSAPALDDEVIVPMDGGFLADGGVSIDDIAELLGLEGLKAERLLAEHQDYHTLAGFILHLAGEIPHTGAVFDYCGYCFTVREMDGNRIDKAFIRKG